ncbi:MAG: hypothetical protein IKZ82_02990 [Clostridia bacterium]|nr:hypothetical protein [Clostridia bacterium]
MRNKKLFISPSSCGSSAGKIPIIGTFVLLKLKYSAFSLAFIASFMLILTISALNSDNGGSWQTGAFKEPRVMYALCYDCSDAGIIKVFEGDLEYFKNRGVEPILQRDQSASSADSVLIVLKNVQGSGELLSELFDNGLKAMIVFEADSDNSEKTAYYKELIDSGKAEAALLFDDETGAHDVNSIGAAFTAMLETRSRLGFTVEACFFKNKPSDKTVSALCSKELGFTLLYYGKGVNIAANEPIMQYSVLRRDSSVSLSEILNGY